MNPEFFPLEVLLNITEYLTLQEKSSFSLVCKSFNQIVKSQNALSFPWKLRDIPDEAFVNIMSTQSALSKVLFPARISSQALLTAARYHPFLRKVDFNQNPNVNDWTLVEFAKIVGESLIDVTLDYSRNITNQGLQAFFEKCPHLQTISLVGCHLTLDSCLFTIANRVRNLKVINLSGCWRLSQQGVDALLSRFRCSIEYITVPPNLHSASFLNLLSQCPQLTGISLGNVNSVEQFDPDLLQQFSHLQNLTHVTVSALLGHLLLPVLNLQNCTSLTIFQCPIDDISFKSLRLNALRSLNLYACPNLHDPAILKYLPQLEKLCLNSDGFQTPFQSLEDVRLSLISFDIHGSDTIQDASIYSLARSAPALEEVDISSTGIMLKSLIYLCEHCPRLKNVFHSFDDLEDLQVRFPNVSFRKI